MAANKPQWVEYMCSWCGAKTTQSVHNGRPYPGRCPRKNGDKPHTWVIKRKY